VGTTRRDEEARADIAARIERVLGEQAKRSELWIAYVRVATLALYTALNWIGYARPDLLFASSFVPLSIPLIVSVFTATSLAVVVSLARGRYHRRLAVALPLLDAAMLTAISLDGVRAFGEAGFVSLGLLERVALACALLALTGGLRLMKGAAITTTALGVAVYVGMAVRVGTLGKMPFTVSLIAGTGLMGILMSGVVQRAVQSEVGKLALERFLPRRLLERAHTDPLAMVDSPRVVEASVLITDIRGFTSLAETMQPADVMELLNEIQGELARVVDEHGGTVDKFMGDGMLAVFGAIEPMPEHARAALRAIVGIRAALDRLNARRESAGLAALRLSAGVHSGALVAGCLGGGPRLEFTVIGDTVNVASRLESMTRDRGVDVLVSDDTAQRAELPESLVEIGEVVIRGRARPMRVHSLRDRPRSSISAGEPA
jgi:class 3 adenylate cyclase